MLRTTSRLLLRGFFRIFNLEPELTADKLVIFFYAFYLETLKPHENKKAGPLGPAFTKHTFISIEVT